MEWLYYNCIYRPLMKVAHRFGWHHMKHHPPYPTTQGWPYGFLKCDWCGIHSDVPYSMKLAKGAIPNPPPPPEET